MKFNKILILKTQEKYRNKLNQNYQIFKINIELYYFNKYMKHLKINVPTILIPKITRFKHAVRYFIILFYTIVFVYLI